jgi:AraC-like DNA-binding protein
MSVSVVLVRALVEAVDAAGASRDEFLRAAALDQDRLKDGDSRFSLPDYDRIQLLALDMTGDDALGLHMGEQVSLAAFDVVGHLLAHATTMREAIELFLRFHRILSDCGDSKLHEKGDLATIEYEYPRGAPRCNRFRAEFGMTVLQWMGRHYVGPGKIAQHVFFEHTAPEYRTEYARIFRGAEVFGCTFTGIEFDRRHLDREQLNKNAELFDVLETQAERKIGRLNRELGYRERLREFLATSIAERPDMETVARRFGMSVRSLRRRLTEEGVTYAGLAEEALSTIAKQMLEDPRRSIQETAYAVGFSDPSAFHRAFKRWTGMTPRQYRERAGAKSG